MPNKKRNVPTAPVLSTGRFSAQEIDNSQKTIPEDMYAPPVTQKMNLNSTKFLNLLSMKQIGPYRILEEIGTGGMGKVYKAYHPQMDRTVAIKIMLRTSEISEQERNRFLAEAKLTAKLQNDCIVKVHDVNAIDGMDYIVMDYVDGISLSSMLKSSKLSLKKSLEIIYEVALAMDYAHNKGVIHRDLKPSNLMIDNRTGRPIIMDFGLAKDTELTSDVTKSGAILGTPRYMAPEQASGKNREVTAVTDVYALGAILYYMVTGTHAVKGDTPGKIIYNVLHEEIVPPRKYNNRLPIKIETICLKALNREPRNRYDSALAFAEDIERYLKGEMLLSPTLTVWHYSAQKLKRYRSDILSIMIVVVFVVSLILSFVKIKYLTNRIQDIEKEQMAISISSQSDKLALLGEQEWEKGYWQKAALLYAKALENEKNTDTNHEFFSNVRSKLAYAIPSMIECSEIISFEEMPTDMALSPTQDMLVIVGEKGLVHTWGNTELSLQSIQDDFYSIEFSNDGRTIVIGGASKVHFFDAQTGKLLSQADNGFPVLDIIFNHYGDRFLTLDVTGKVKIWDFYTKTLITSLPIVITSRLSMHPSKEILYAGNALGNFYSFDLSTIEQKITTVLPLLLHRSQITDIIVDDQRIITGSLDGTIQLMRFEGVAEYTATDFPTSLQCLAALSEVNIIAAGAYDNKIYMWDIYTKKIQTILQGHEDLPKKLIFNKTGELLFSLALDKTLRIWKIPTNNRKIIEKHTEAITDIVFLNNKKQFASSSLDKQVCLWNMDGKLDKTLKVAIPVFNIAIDPSEKKILVGSINKIEEWGIAESKLLQHFVTDNGNIMSITYIDALNFLMTDRMSVYIKSKTIDKRLYLGNAWAYSACYEPTSKTILFSYGKNISKWTLGQTNDPNVIVTELATITCVSIDSGGKQLAYGTLNGTIRIQNIESGEELASIITNNGFIRSILFNSNNEIVTTDSNGYLKIWDTKTGKNKFSIRNHSQDAICLTSYNSYTFISGSRDGRIVIREVKPELQFMSWDNQKIIEYVKNYTKLYLSEDLEILPLDGQWK